MRDWNWRFLGWKQLSGYLKLSLLNYFFKSQCSHLKGGEKEKESKIMPSKLTHQAAKINLLFTHLSHGEKKENLGWQYKQRENEYVKTLRFNFELTLYWDSFQLLCLAMSRSDHDLWCHLHNFNVLDPPPEAVTSKVNCCVKRQYE